MSTTTTLGTELVEAAEKYIGREAIYHQKFTGNCIERPTGHCQEIGLGLDQFDCSGLVLRSLGDVLGGIPESWLAAKRHVRDIWAKFAAETPEAISTEPEPGSLLVTHRRYTTDGITRPYPGHIAFVRSVQQNGLEIIHASAPTGRVEQQKIPLPQWAMGYISLSEL